MSMEPKPTRKRFRLPKPRTQPLKRGRACLNCRFVRCDGMRPVCGNCTRVPKGESCKFTDPLSKANLEHHAAGSSEFPEKHFVNESHSGYLSTPMSSFSEISSDGQSESRSNNSSNEASEPPFETIQLLLQNFLPHATQFGFALHIERFTNATLIPQIPFGNILRPSQSLLYAVYLWGAHLSPPGPLFDLKPTFLRRALQATSTETFTHNDTVHALHMIQAHILLGNYSLMQKRLLSAQLHANAAATLAMSYKLHRSGSVARSEMLHGALYLDSIDELDAHLAPAQDSVEEGERVRCFWAVVSLQTSINLASQPDSQSMGLNSCLLECLGREIDTPWPMQIVEYELMEGYRSADNYEGETIQRFMMKEPSGEPYPVGHVQATVLLHHSMRFSKKWASDIQLTESSSSMNTYTSLSTRIAQFWSTLPPVYPSCTPELILTHCLIAAASLSLHRPFVAFDPAAQTKCLAAARAIIQSLRLPISPETVFAVTPVLGTICASACNALLDELERTRTMWAEWAAAPIMALDVDVDVDVSLPSLPACEQESILLMDLQEGIGILEMYASGSPLAEHQLKAIQQRHNSHYASL
ncbi:Zn(2)-C6 fungal-type domain-containing protein [Favolaschia claudopus]|uniref:Zn(2)-C6 fungal-type domain-containing protein n=1 Tax=Favolaschia claudopus TaxID=2862362 RepID=A0AAW0C665_9AGAR